MDVIKFNLSGSTAFFKIPEVNAYFYFTYGCIHRIALLGIFGAICGYGGYNQQKGSEEEFPEFYSKLKDIKIAIVPKKEKGYISKKVQVFNNSVGYASKEEGGNLIVKEQWLEDPEWDIYVQVIPETEELVRRLLNQEYMYIPYLGKNDHFADITNVEIIKNVKIDDDVKNIDSLFLSSNVEIILSSDSFNFDDDDDVFKYEEMLPVELDTITNNYALSTFIFTNNQIRTIDSDSTYNCNGKSIYFF